MLVMMFTMSVYSFAEDNNATEIERVEKYDIKVNTKRLAQFLDLSADQYEAVDAVINEFSSDMMFAAVMNTEESRNSIVANAVKKNIKNMHYVLNDAQYKKYLMLLNLTLEHRGFDITKISK